MTRVVIIGGGFGGLHAALRLRGPVEVTLVDRRNFHLFQPLLYQVATGGLSPGNIAVPLRHILRRHRNVRVLLGEATGFDLARREVAVVASGAARALPYDRLVVAAGMRTDYHGHDAWEARAPGLKSVEDAVGLRRRILTAFEAAESAHDPADVEELLTFVVVGGGPTGVELAGTLGEIARFTLRHEFRSIDPARARILLVELGPRVLPGFPETLSAAAARGLSRLRVDVRTSTGVREIDDRTVVLAHEGQTEVVRARNVVWAAGVRASPLGAMLQAGTDRAGRVKVNPDLSLPGRPEVFVIGDLAATGLPGLAPVAIQMGEYVARRILGKAPDVFRYKDRGTMAVIGRASAVADFGRVRLTGYPAWLAWLFVHLVQLVLFANKLLVLLQWAWNYLTFGRSARIITHEGKG
ncbi:MAG TPA: NAD(P)/FAD-dependent oxidoreductase [Planctomycetota bacterium]|nr:NAD(P)/FAD-dependent oxidoreductase [Planctomycetota bacterium]